MALAKKAAPYDIDLARDMKLAQEKHGAGFGKQITDFLALRSAGTGLSFDEYHYFSLYGHDRKEYPAYMGDDRSRAAFYVANKIASWDEAEDKLLFHGHVSAAKLPTPTLVAVAHDEREADGAKLLRTNEKVKSFLAECSLPIFGKPVNASHGDGVINISARDGEHLVLDDGSSVSIEDVADAIEPYFDGDGFLFQEVLVPHETISTITDGRLSTIRLMVWLGPDGAKVKNAVCRLPAGENRVDNFRRDGNLVASIDLGTGMLGAAYCGVGVNTQKCTIHPDTHAQIENVVLSDFAEAKALVEKAATLYPDLRIQSWDVALTDEGPKLVEVNPGGNFNIIQLANGRGAFDPEFREFLQYCMSDNPAAKENPKALKEARKLLKLK